MELRQYLDILKRHRWFIVQAVVVVAVVAGVVSGLRTPRYEAKASLFLRPNDPSEQLDPTQQQQSNAQVLDRYMSAQKDIAESDDVAAAAAKSLHGVTKQQVLDTARAHQSGTSDVMLISATDTDPATARDIANAVARAYVENRRLSAVAGLEKATSDIEARLGDLQKRIGDLDARIGDGSTPVAGATSKPKGPTNPTANATPPQSSDGPQQGLDLGGQPTSLESLKAARYAAATQYESLFSRQQDLLVEQNLKRGEAEVIGLASTPKAPVSPKPKRDAALGAIVGLLLGVGISFLREQLDDRIRSREDAEQANELPVLAELPLDEEAATKGTVAVHSHPHGPLAEASRSLRTSLLFLGFDKPIRRILVTSPGPGDGKSLVSANLAAAFAQAGQTTVIVSADLRRPSIEKLFGVDRHANGLSELMTRDLPALVAAKRGNGQSREIERGLGPALVPVEPDDLYILPAGPTPPNPAELLGSGRMRQVLAEIDTVADIVIIDSPPLLAVTDAAALAPLADAVLIVNAVGETHRSAAKRAKELVENADVKVLGLVLNKVDTGASGYYRYYDYYGDAKTSDGRRGRRSARRLRVRAEARSRGKRQVAPN